MRFGHCKNCYWWDRYAPDKGRNTTESGISATTVRRMILEDSNELKDVVPSLVYEQRYVIKNLIELSKLKS